MRVDVITIFPEMFHGVLGVSMMKRAQEHGAVEINVVNLRDFAHDRHQSVDDRPYGGGAGMVMRPEPIFEAVESLADNESYVILLSPQGRTFSQAIAEELICHRHVVLICGHYEGVDERVRSTVADDEISIGDYILTSGNLPAMVMIDAMVRLMPGVLGCAQSTLEESFADGLLEYPQYTRPEEYRGLQVPEVLRSGNHGKIRQWRENQAWDRTQARRPDLYERLKKDDRRADTGGGDAAKP